MSIVRQDGLGLFVISGGYIARPLEGRSQFLPGNDVPTRHFAGSGVHGVGRGPQEARGEYTEYWFTSGTAEQHPIRGGDESAYLKTAEWYARVSDGPTQAWLRTRAQQMRRERASRP